MWYNGLFNIYLGANDMGKMTKTKLNKLKNNYLYQITFTRLMHDALNRYTLKKLPDTMSERVVLQSFLWYGSVIMFEKDGAYVSLPGVPSGKGWNAYGDTAEAWVFSMNGVFNEPVDIYLPGEDKSSFLKRTTSGFNAAKPRGVLVRENATMFPFINTVMYYSQAISDSMRTLDVCRQNIKQPFIITAEESIVNSVKKFFDERDNNNEYIISSGVFAADRISLLPIQTNSDSLNAATELVDWYENKYRELCGIDNNSQIDKKGENLIQSEVSVNDMYTQNSVDKCIEYIQSGLDDVNKLFGLDIRVEPKRKELIKNENIFRDNQGTNGISRNDTNRPAEDNN